MKRYVKLSVIPVAIVTVVFNFSTVGAIQSKNSTNDSITSFEDVYNVDMQEKCALAEIYYDAVIAGDHQKISEARKAFDEISFGGSNTDGVALHYTILNPDGSPPDNYIIDHATQYPQEKSYYCGPAAAKTILDAMGIYKSQTELASDKYLMTEYYGNTPWYKSNGDNYTQFPMVTTLLDIQTEAGGTVFRYGVTPIGNAGANPLTVKQCKAFITSTTTALDRGYCVAACGASLNKKEYQLPGYPARKISHWIVCNGYENLGESVYIIDPAAKSEAVTWSGNIEPEYKIDIELFRNFIEPRGIVF